MRKYLELIPYFLAFGFVIAFCAGDAHSQSVPFNAYSVQTLGGNCTQQGSVMTQTANGRSICLGTGGNGQVLKSNGAGADVSWTTVSGVGTVTSVGLSAPSQFSVANSPITAAGTLALSWQNQTANSVLAGPTSGAAAAPTFRALVGDDLPNPSSTKKGGVISSAAPTNQFATGVNTSGVVTYAQPAFSNLSGQASSAQIAAGAAVANLGYTPLNPANNLSDVSSVSSARTNLVVPGLATSNTFTAINSLAKGADVASAATLAIGNDGNYFNVTGTTNISAISSKGVGTVIRLHFNSALALINGTTLVLPGSANLAVNAGAEASFVEYSSGNWRLVDITQSEPNWTAPIITPWVSYTPSTNGFGTLTNVNVKSRRVNSDLELKFYFLTGSPSASEARVFMGYNGVDNSVTSASAEPNISVVGQCLTTNAGSTPIYVLSELSKNYLVFGTTTNGLTTKLTGSGMTAASKEISCTAKVQIDGW